MDSERRRAPRYPIVADAEVTEIASETWSAEEMRRAAAGIRSTEAA